MRVFKIQTMADDEAGIFFQKLMDGRMDEVMSSLLPPYFAPFLPKTPAASNNARLPVVARDSRELK